MLKGVDEMGILKALKESETKRFLKYAEKKVKKIENLSEQMKVVYGKNLKNLRSKVLGNDYSYRIH